MKIWISLVVWIMMISCNHADNRSSDKINQDSISTKAKIDSPQNNGGVVATCVGCFDKGDRYNVGSEVCIDGELKVCTGVGEEISPGCYGGATWELKSPATKCP